jgi:hypothetical protein
MKSVKVTVPSFLVSKKKETNKLNSLETQPQETSSMGWIIAAIVVVVIIAFLIMKGP